MKKDPWINYGKATFISVICCITYFVFGLDNIGNDGLGMAFIVWMGTTILIALINLLYALPGEWLNEIKYCLPGLLTLPFVLRAEDKPADLINFSNPIVGLVYMPLLINALFGLYFFSTGWSVKKE